MNKRNIIKEINLSGLPKWENNINNGGINWGLCGGYKVNFKYANIVGVIEILRYDKKNKKLIIQYLNKEIDIGVHAFISCNLSKYLDIPRFGIIYKYEIGQILKDDKRDITITSKKIIQNKKGHNKKYYQYKCNICGFDSGEYYRNGVAQREYWIEESCLDGYGCACCSSHLVMSGVNDIYTTHPQLTRYFADMEDIYKYSFGSSQKVKMICPECNNIRDMKIVDMVKQGFSCPKCNDGISYPNKFMFNILKQLEVDFVSEYSPSWIKPKRYDFYIPSVNLIIEMDGGLGHGKRNKRSGVSSKDSREIDICKDEKARLYGIKVIRIDCDYKDINTTRFEFIKEIISKNKEINKLFDLSKINWLNCHEFAISSRIKEVCDLFMLHIHSMNEIQNITKLGRNTITRYLKEGVLLGLCDYNSMETHRQNSIVTARKMGNPILCTTTGQPFNSPTECSRVSGEVFGVHMNQCVLNKYIKENKPYKGYDFKFITREQYDDYLNKTL